MTDDELEQQLKLSRATSPSAALRERVLTNVTRELRSVPVPRRSWGWLLAASILLALGVNILAIGVVQHRVSSYVRSEPAQFVRLEAPAQQYVESVAIHQPGLIQWFSESPATDREEFEHYMSELVAHASWQDVPSLP